MNTPAKYKCLLAVVRSGAAQTRQNQQKFHTDDVQFGKIRLFWRGTNHSEGHSVIHHGQPPWDTNRFGQALAA